MSAATDPARTDLSASDDAADTAAARLSRWAERDAVVGLSAELEQVAAQLLERDREVVNVRERAANLAQRVAQLTVERDRLHHQVQTLQRPSFASRAYRRARRVAGRLLRR